MRQRPDWMTPTDEMILQTLADSDLVLSPAILAYNLQISREHVTRRLSEFVKYGLVDRPDRGKYEITGKARAYLDGELSVDDLVGVGVVVGGFMMWAYV